jgi:hypothetical protein
VTLGTASDLKLILPKDAKGRPEVNQPGLTGLTRPLKQGKKNDFCPFYMAALMGVEKLSGEAYQCTLRPAAGCKFYHEDSLSEFTLKDVEEAVEKCGPLHTGTRD